MSRLAALSLLLLAACVTDGVVDTDSGDTDTDSGDTDTADTDGDTGDTGATDTGDTDSGDTDSGDTDSGDTDSGDTDSGDTDTGPDGLSLELVAQGLTRPVGVTAPPGDPRLFIIEKRGTVRVVQADGTVSSTFFLDLRGEVDTGHGEQGLLGLAFHPDFATNGKAYVNYTDTAGDTVVAEYGVVGSVAQTGTKRVVLEVNQPFDNHNGGHLAFGPDGYLYIGLGDGGSGNDPDERAQDRTTLLGKMLRIDPLGGDTTDNDPAYGIPSDNPYAGVITLIRREIWSYGLRNPWRYAFDRQTGDLWIADVGQDHWEEIDFQPASSDGGENWGWDECEGDHDAGSSAPCTLDGALPPIHEYAQPLGCSITGGFVYRGAAIPSLQGRYLYADYCAGFVRSFVQTGGVASDHVDHTVDLSDGGTTEFGWISAFGEDAAGEPYLCDHTEGKVWRIVE